MKHFLTELKSLGVKESYVVIPISAVEPEELDNYWRALQMADTLKYRWSDMKDPTADQVISYCQEHSQHKYAVMDVDAGTMKAEFSLGPYSGKAAQIHFSMHPTNETSLNHFLAETVTDSILYNWKDVVNLEESFLDTLFGVTPVPNRPACIFIRKAGFQAMGTILSGAKYLNETCDGLFTTKSRKV